MVAGRTAEARHSAAHGSQSFSAHTESQPCLPLSALFIPLQWVDVFLCCRSLTRW